MNKNIGYGASLLLIAGACGLFFGPLEALASGDSAPDYGGGHDDDGGGHDGKDECKDVCECVDKALSIVNDPEIKAGDDNVRNPQDVVKRVRKQLEECQKICDDKKDCG
ncbi:uncharacterized protein SOCE26_051670 [Sorangium cellulosum]|uniref:Secreted protein n=1 Tax=Sorangium cellulosum TaxID=56 RepID=A0A2L0EWN5_SORCE|nr:hypothetical protein [Sorangium cellulosum]AUX43714.1 uncharacterized protein SOCE26_051670 [Sorangium cellulosum]